MEEQEFKDLKKYAKPSHALAVLGAFFVIIGLFVVVMGLTTDSYDSTEYIVTGIIGVLLGVLFIYLGIRDNKKFDKKLKEIEENGGMPILLNDFKTGGRAFKNSLIVGQTFLIGKKSGTIVTYNEIVQIYQYVHSTNFVEDSRTLKVKTIQNSVLDLCSIPLRGKGNDELEQVINYILSKNPNVKVGYK